MIRKAALLALLVCSLASPSALAYPQETKPNIVIILVDDLGYRGGDIKSPNIDKLAIEGVRLESFYGMPVCYLRAVLATGSDDSITLVNAIQALKIADPFWGKADSRKT